MEDHDRATPAERAWDTDLGAGAARMAIFAGALQLIAAAASVRLWTPTSQPDQEPGVRPVTIT